MRAGARVGDDREDERRRCVGSITQPRFSTFSSGSSPTAYVRLNLFGRLREVDKATVKIWGVGLAMALTFLTLFWFILKVVMWTRGE